MGDKSRPGSSKKYSKRNTAVRRIYGDIKELQKDPSDQYWAAPLDDNLFDWHATIRGPPDTAFEGGVYHLRILLSPQYPFKPPNVVFLTPNGRFQLNTKICLSMSAYHPEMWQPAWGVRTILEALIVFLPTPGEGAVGALDWPDDERRRLAKESVKWCCPKCGNAKALLPELCTPKEGEKEKKKNPYAEQVAQLHMHNMGSVEASSTPVRRRQKNSSAKPQESQRDVHAGAAQKQTQAKRETQSKDRATRREEKQEDSLLLSIIVMLALALVMLLLRKYVREYV